MPELLIPGNGDVRKTRNRASAKSNAMDATVHLRSINVTLDNATPQRIAHFYPTAKSARLLRSWLQPDQASNYVVVAPYGTGKSLAATFFIQVVENLQGSGEVLGRITDRFTKVDSDLASDLRSRLGSEQMPLFDAHGATIPLSGFQPDLPNAIKRSFIASLRRTGNTNAAALASRRRVDSMDELIALLGAVRDRYCPDPIDRLAIVWDEFGRHLEELILRGTASDLSDVQTLAEFCARTKRAPTTLTLLLHQGLMRYAMNTAVAVQHEWKKIEGRFETVQFVDDSKELYQLVARIVRDMRACDSPPRAKIDQGVQRCHEVGLFKDCAPKEMERLVAASYPLEPMTLYLLPRVSSRVAQNERTLFTFLNSIDAAAPISPDILYDYFSDAMRADTLPGGSYHAWLETESALHKACSDIDKKTLKCACLLGLGLMGERSRVSRQLLECAASGYRNDASARGSVERLIGAKLLLYRRNADSVSVWHGTDLDIRGRLDQEKERLRPRFDHVSFLTSEAPPAPWKPIDYNGEYCVERSFESHYVAAKQIIMGDGVTQTLPPTAPADGTLYIVVPDSDDERVEVRKRLAAEQLAPDVIVAIPRHVGRIAEIALETRALQLLRQDSSLLAEDPLVESELAQMTDDAQGYLNQQLHHMSQPSADGPEYLWKARFYEIESAKELRQLLSKIMRQEYPLTPRIKNELIVRRRPRPVIVNARKKLISAILDCSGAENLKLEGYRPDMSMFRTVLLQTGLYRRDVERPADERAIWSYAAPKELEDTGLREVWSHLRDYLTVPANHPKKLSDLCSPLKDPPYGVRAGIVPILLAAALRAFPGPISITRIDGEYVNDLLPTTIETMCSHPEEYHVLVPKLTTDQSEFLYGVTRLFGFAGMDEAETDPVRRCHDALVQWRSTLPRSAFTSRYLSPKARAFGRLMTTAIDPHPLLYDALPATLGVEGAATDVVLRRLRDCKAEIEGVVLRNYHAAERAIRSAFPAPNGISVKPTLRQVVQAWAEFFPADVAEEINDGIARTLIHRASTSYQTDREMADALAALLVHKRIDRWDDSTIFVFERELGAVIRRAEDTMLSVSADADGAKNQSVVHIATSRLRTTLRAITNVTGADEARTIVARTLDDLIKEGSANGSHARSARSAR